MAKPIPSYCLSGLGADHRLFQGISIPGAQLIEVPWISPLKKEPIGDYARRLLSDMLSSSPRPFFLMGSSFGGMLAQEIAPEVMPDGIILISSLVSRAEVAAPARMMSTLGLHKLAKGPLLKLLGPVGTPFFSIKSTEHKQLFKDMLTSSDPDFQSWAIQHVATWNGPMEPFSGSVIRIHGTADLVIPAKNLQTDIDPMIPDAGHFLIMEQARQISEFLASRLNIS